MVMMLPAEISEAPKPSDGALPPEDMELLEVMSPGRKSSLGWKLPLTLESLLGWPPFCGGCMPPKLPGWPPILPVPLIPAEPKVT